MAFSWIDTHAHLYLPVYEKDVAEVIATSQAVGVVKAYQPNLNLASIEPMLELVGCYPGFCHAMLGLHPCEVKADYRQHLHQMEQWLGTHPFVAIGEVGLDLHWDTSYLAEQKEALKIAISWAEELNLPLVVHGRKGTSAILQLLQRYEGNLRGIFHCFSGTVTEAETAIAQGFLIGVGGVVTFRNQTLLSEVVCAIPLEYMVLETDSPYLTPHPYRGKRNHPQYIPLIGAQIAALKGCSIAEVAQITSRNAIQLFHPTESA